MYETLLAVHILAAALWVGGGVTMHVFGRRAKASGSNSRMVEFARDANVIGPRFYAPLSLVLLVAGILLVDEAGYRFSDAFITVGFAGWIVSFVIGVTFYGAQGRKLEAVVAGEGVESPGIFPIYDRVMAVNVFELSVLLLVLVDMTVKPGL